MAMRLDGKIKSVAGAFLQTRRNPDYRARICFSMQTVYADYRTMAAEEAKLPVGERIDFVSVVTPIEHICRFPKRSSKPGSMSFVISPWLSIWRRRFLSMRLLRGQQDICIDSQLHRLSAGLAGAPACSKWRTR